MRAVIDPDFNLWAGLFLLALIPPLAVVALVSRATERALTGRTARASRWTVRALQLTGLNPGIPGTAVDTSRVPN